MMDKESTFIAESRVLFFGVFSTTELSFNTSVIVMDIAVKNEF